MIWFIPLDTYEFVVLGFILTLVYFAAFLYYNFPRAMLMSSPIPNKPVRTLAWATALIITMLLGLRPISYAFGDMGTYFIVFQSLNSDNLVAFGDPLFDWVMQFFSYFFNAEAFFFFCALVYVFGIVAASISLLGKYWPAAFFYSLTIFDFYGYGVNGIRQGMAASVFLLALSTRSLLLFSTYSLLALLIHKSLIVSIIIALVARLAPNPRYYIIAWVTCLLVGLVAAEYAEQFANFALSSADESQYTQATYLFDQMKTVGFRIDFVVYSMIPILVGAYFLKWREINDLRFRQLYCSYLGINSFWLLMMETSVSNRFAYLSWSMMGLVVSYGFVFLGRSRAEGQAFALLLLALISFTVVKRTWLN